MHEERRLKSIFCAWELNYNSKLLTIVAKINIPTDILMLLFIYYYNC
jgi:hypothetical protein